MAPLIGFHSVIERPLSVRRVIPPTTTIAKTSAATAKRRFERPRGRGARWALMRRSAPLPAASRGARPHVGANVILYRRRRCPISAPVMASRPMLTGRLDRIAMGLSGLCAVHCVATAILLGLLASAGGLLGQPIIHEVGLTLAMVIGAFALGGGYR